MGTLFGTAGAHWNPAQQTLWLKQYVAPSQVKEDQRLSSASLSAFDEVNHEAGKSEKPDPPFFAPAKLEASGIYIRTRGRSR